MSRPFNQPVFDLTKIRVTTLSGFVYKFTLIIPVLLEGEQVFSESDRARLRNLLTADFGGCTYTKDINHPLAHPLIPSFPYPLINLFPFSL